MDGGPCDDGDPCTGNDTCVQGVCVGEPLDCSPPVVEITSPFALDGPASTRVVWEPPQSPSVQVTGRITDDQAIQAASLRVGPTVIELASGPFAVPVTLDVTGPGPFVDNEIVLSARDTAGNETTIRVVLSIAVEAVRGTIAVRFAPGMTREAMRQVLALHGLTELSSAASIGHFVASGAEAEVGAKIVALRRLAQLLAADRVRPLIPHGELHGWPNDKCTSTAG